MRSYIFFVFAGLLGAGFFTFAVLPGFNHAAWAEIYDVEMQFDEDTGDVSFEPSRLEIRSGDTVRWVQTDGINEHNIVSYPDRIPKGTEMFESPLISAVGESWSHTFEAPGTYEYHCHPHEAVGMHGVIIVDRESTPDEFRQPKPGEHVHEKGAHGAPMGDHAPMKMDHGEDHGGQHH